ncbi:hypothetical protein E6O75_ATG04728 [Venturia nashicola]|uniref:ER-bound oxygenase mpaB/mpaB'/Rubber oxygenase catalytic domain-containing protein n=1 Tax=Venturia nashicola TaxID=86259 RepID=A0A4Z1P1P0_9PEZI|nr:hypothetical protein E6O75_ATG04728 [Venturia nashicola]
MPWTEDIPTWQLVLLSVLGYVYLCRVLRYRRLQQKEALYPYKTREDYANMTNQHAYEIQKYLFSVEFPFTTQKALEFALFRTYGIPSISKLLVKTNLLSNKEFASRRYADTTVLIAEFIAWSPEAERTNAAIARMNYFHSIYQKKNLISNDDMLYTLSLFAIEPVRWVKRYEWRQMTEMEICAMSTFWKSIGDAMNISYDPLPSYPNGWRDGLEFYQELQSWSLQYEEKSMLPSAHNKKTADETTALLLYDVPTSAIPTGRAIVSALMDDRLRKAMMYPPPPSYIQTGVETALTLRKLALRYLALPRPHFLRHDVISEKADKNGRYHRVEYESEPWYMESSLRNRWGPQAWFKWIGGKPIPGALYKPQGYLIHEVGPKSQEGRGLEEFEEGKEKLMREARGGCPFSFVK